MDHRCLPVAAALSIAVTFTGCVQDNQLIDLTEQVPDIVVEPDSIDLRALLLNDVAAATVRITNEGRAPLRLEAVSLVDAVGLFSLTNSVPDGLDLEPGETVEVEIGWVGALSGDNSTAVRIDSNSPSEARVEVPIRATVLAPDLTLDPPQWYFGTWGMGCGTGQTFTVTNTGTAPLVIADWTLDVGLEPAHFTATTALAPGFVLEAGASQPIDIEFLPQSDGNFAATLQVDTQDPLSLSVLSSLAGTGRPPDWNTDHYDASQYHQSDILWVVDNSCSMGEEQQSIATNFEVFMDMVEMLNIDYRMAVITTDQPRFQSDGSTRVVTPSTYEAATVFATLVSLGVTGSGNGKVGRMTMTGPRLGISMTMTLQTTTLRTTMSQMMKHPTTTPPMMTPPMTTSPLPETMTTAPPRIRTETDLPMRWIATTTIPTSTPVPTRSVTRGTMTATG